jgi:hypothetical protein
MSSLTCSCFLSAVTHRHHPVACKQSDVTVWSLQEMFQQSHCQALEHAIIILCCSGWLHVLCYVVTCYVLDLFNDAASIAEIIYRNNEYAW